jgi:MoxR-like ATPase
VLAAVNGQTAVSTDDIRAIAYVALRHRIILNFEGEAQQVSVDDMIKSILAHVKAPAAEAS